MPYIDKKCKPRKSLSQFLQSHAKLYLFQSPLVFEIISLAYRYICLKVTFFAIFVHLLDEKDHRIRDSELGFSVICHIDDELITEKIPKYFSENENNKTLLKLKEGKYKVKNDQLLKMSIEYYEQQLKGNIEGVYSIPDIDVNDGDADSTLPDNIQTIMKTLKKWCNNNDNQEDGSIKGLVIYGFNLDRYLKFLKFPENILENDLYTSDPAVDKESNNIIIACNPMERVVFLFRIDNTENLKDGIKLSTNDAVKFELLNFDVLKGSGVQLINFLVTEKNLDEFPLCCEFCKHQVISVKSIASSDSFKRFWNGKKEKFRFSVLQDNEDFLNYLCAKLLFLITTSRIPQDSLFHEMLPLRTEIPLEQMEEAEISTSEELRIIHSKHKRHVVYGCYGSAISTVARKRAEVISNRLNGDVEVLYFLCCKLNYQLLEKGNKSSVKLYRNHDLKKPVDIVKDILKEEKAKKKVHVVAEQYDIEELSDAESMELNRIFETDDRFKDSYVFFACGFITVERKIEFKGQKYSKGKWNMNGSFKTEQLKHNKRNPKEINKLVVSVSKELKNEPTTFSAPIQDARERYSNEYRKFTFDETFEFYYRNHSKSRADRCNNRLIVESHFTYSMEPIQRGLMIKSVKPSIAIINGSKELIVERLSDILDKIIKRTYREKNDYRVEQGCKVKKHVILHFDVQNDIPECFNAAFDYLKIQEKITTDFKEFKEKKDKKILICNYRSFRGNENPSVIVVLDPSLHHLKFCVPECLSRATVFLEIIVVKMLDDDESVNSQEHFERIISKLGSQECESELFCIPCRFTPTETRVSEDTEKSVAKPEIQMQYKKEMNSNLLR